MPPTKDRYHHGALREELLRASLQLIDTEGLAAVSLRRVAREAGVSPGAPYHHFPDRAALLAALSTRGYEILREELLAARAADPDPRAVLTGMAEAYVRFAVANPSYFRLMFRPELIRSDKVHEPGDAGDAAFAVLETALADAIRAGVLPAADAETLALAWWALAHGLASLEIDGKLGKRAAEMGTTAKELGNRIITMFAALIDRTGGEPT
ncbi:TetR/AcrR family transcriptional regulator [Nocardia jejuensis]|uniref:TetR/AcrR family transcriptional regulator n=1 Tax=Nocardia jejuensis TaxID=328049 RepID=UPI00083635A9|nr:TetR/AcrR family transcriptional regulator [Nocardia jejuensis]